MISFYLTGFILVLLDQAAKYFIKGTVNYGAAFGILQGYKWLFIVVSLIAISVLIFYEKKLKGIGFYGGVLLFSGAIGNLIDRIFFGYVRDFIDLKIWPSFNLADSYNTIGIILLVIYFWKR